MDKGASNSTNISSWRRYTEARRRVLYPEQMNIKCYRYDLPNNEGDIVAQIREKKPVFLSCCNPTRGSMGFILTFDCSCTGSFSSSRSVYTKSQRLAQYLGRKFSGRMTWN